VADEDRLDDGEFLGVFNGGVARQSRRPPDWQNELCERTSNRAFAMMWFFLHK
jgi:hypothetical protein